jgi:hypothetical protein
MAGWFLKKEKEETLTISFRSNRHEHAWRLISDLKRDERKKKFRNLLVFYFMKD